MPEQPRRNATVDEAVEPLNRHFVTMPTSWLPLRHLRSVESGGRSPLALDHGQLCGTHNSLDSNRGVTSESILKGDRLCTMHCSLQVDVPGWYNASGKLRYARNDPAGAESCLNQ